MGRGKDVEGLSKRNAQAQATRLGVTGSLGVPIGKTLGQMPLYGTWEDMHIDIWGPRTGKTTSRAVPRASPRVARTRTGTAPSSRRPTPRARP